jgi:hypothetical protein
MTSPLQQKLRVTGPSVVTANRLADGVVVYRTADGGWSAELSAAAVITNAEEAKALLAAARADFLRAVDPYVAPVEFAGERMRPANLRERIRAEGPTIALPGA